ncbi:hypothetical protein EMPS_08507 [Entomortierella parvispora]|uniref:Arm-like repeat domain-containing protein n=1 Tax=Entomortierella parvispora TaxID=205924 RepID=A0A9P3LZG2_9FUNG|nr:hypothetical protein EMPS_08507 [Entomortierella parvispora]
MAPTLCPNPNPNPNPRSQKFWRMLKSSKKPSRSQSPPQAPQNVTRVPPTPTSIPSGIFPKNDVNRVEIDVTLPKDGENIESTLQLVSCATLLARASTSSTPPVPAPSLNPNQHDWIEKMKNQPLEEQHIYQLARQMVGQFQPLSTKDTTIREAAILGPALDKLHYRALLNCFLKEFRSNTLLSIDLLRGLVQLVLDAPDYYLRGEDLILVLGTIRERLEKSSEKDKLYSTHLSVAVCKVLIFMASCEVKELERKEEYEPLLKVLGKLRTDKEDPFVRFYGEYAFQALLCFSDGEGRLAKLGRHTYIMVGGALKISGAYKLDLDGIAEGTPAAARGFAGLVQALREMAGVKDESPWYSTTQFSAELIKSGRLKEFNELINKSPCRRDAMFLWATCQLLGEMALDPIWDVDTRKQTVKFLGEMFKANAGQTQKRQDIRRWILTILDHISKDPGSRSTLARSLATHQNIIKQEAFTLARDLEKDGTKPIDYPYTLSKRLPLPDESLLLKKVDSKPGIELLLQRFGIERQGELNTESIFIPPYSRPSLHATGDTTVLLQDQTNLFLSSNKSEVFLILGDSGAGKSTFSLNLEYRLWKDYKPGDPIPLLIDLKTIDKPDNDLIGQHLKNLHLFSKDQTEELRLSREFILICDGYDECRKWPNLHANNRLNKERQWKGKMIICCRSQYLGANYRHYFEPQEGNVDNQSFSDMSDLLEEAVIVPFKADQIMEYVGLYINTQEARALFYPNPVWTMDKYRERLDKITNLMDLAQNPFLLRIVLDTLPRIASETTRVTRAELYDHFVELNFETEVRKLILQHSSDKMDDVCVSKFQEMEGDDFIFLGLDFSKRLSASIFKELGGVNSVDYSVKDEGSWKADFFSLKDDRTKLLRESAQLVRRENLKENGKLMRHIFRSTRKPNSYEFIHRSVLEYFFSCVIFEPRVDISDQTLAACLAGSDSSSSLANHPLGQKSLVDEPSIIHFLAERANQRVEFRDQLLEIVKLSKSNPQVEIAAANAITILARAEVNFNGMDLAGIQITGADLTGAQFDSAKLQNSNLSQVNFTRGWLRQADFSGANMSGITFGQKPFFEIAGARTCAGSSSGTMLALGFEKDIVIYNSGTWDILRTLRGHRKEILSLAFSHDDRTLASGSADNTVRIWDLHGEPNACFVIEEHTGRVNCVAYSSDGSWIASGSEDKSVRIVNTTTGSTSSVLDGHTNGIQSIAWSPDGKNIATGSGDKVRTWNATTGGLHLALVGNLQSTSSVAFSPDGQLLAAGSKDDIHVWNLKSGADAMILKGHTNLITSVAFSRDGRWIVSSSEDKSVRLWERQSGTLICNWRGHKEAVHKAVFLSDRTVASCARDQSIRLWDFSDNQIRKKDMTNGLELERHCGGVNTVTYSSKGEWILSGSTDKSVREWNAETGVPKVLVEHVDTITAAAYSIDDDQVAVTVESGELLLYKKQDDSEKRTLAGPSRMGRCVAFSSCRRWMAIGTIDGRVRLWDMVIDAEYGLRDHHTGPIHNMVFAPNGRQLATCSEEDTIRLWNTDRNNSGPVLEEVLSHSATSIAYSLIGDTLAFGTKNGTVCLWDVVHKDIMEMELKRRSGSVVSVAWSPCGNWFSTISQNFTLQLWKKQGPDDFHRALLLKNFVVDLTSLAWSPDESKLEFVTGSQDHSVCVWKVVPEGKKARVQLVWGSSLNRLVSTGADISHAIDLDVNARKLLRQLEAEDRTAKHDTKVESLMNSLHKFRM